MGILTRLFWQVTGLMIPRENVYCWGKKKPMNYDSFHIKQTYLWQRALRTPSTSTDTITNWPANHLARASKVQIRYLRSLKADSTVCRPSSLVLSEPCFASNEKKRLGLSSNMRKILDNSAKAQKKKKKNHGGYSTAKILHGNWNSPLILPACLKRLGSRWVVRHGGGLPKAYEVISLIFIHLMMTKNVNWWLHSFRDDPNESFILK